MRYLGITYNNDYLAIILTISSIMWQLEIQDGARDELCHCSWVSLILIAETRDCIIFCFLQKGHSVMIHLNPSTLGRVWGPLDLLHVVTTYPKAEFFLPTSLIVETPRTDCPFLST